MGMFDFLKKDKADEDDGVMTSSRYTLMVEDAFLLKDRVGVVVVGNLHGEIKVGDVAYICHHTRPMVGVKVKGIEIGKNQQVDSASNQHVALWLDKFTSRQDVPKYAVISGMEPQAEAAAHKAVENPMLLGLSMEYGRFARDEQYLNTLIYAATHAHCITPVKMDNKPVDNGDGTATFTSDTTISFVSVTNPGMPGVNVLPLFTDWAAISINESLFEGEKKETMILRFPDAVAVAKNGYAGMVINPYGPVPVFLPMELVEHITTLDGYKREFGE